LGYAQKAKPTTAAGWIQRGDAINREVKTAKGRRKNNLRDQRLKAYTNAVRLGANPEEIKNKSVRKEVEASVSKVPKKKEPSPFKQVQKETPKKKRDIVWVSENSMDFTRLPKKELDKLLAETDKMATAQLAKAEAKAKKIKFRIKTTKAPKAISSPKLRAEVRSWLNSSSKYKKIAAKVKEHERNALAASRSAQKLASRGIRGEPLLKELDKLFVNRHKATETRREMENFMKNHQKEFREANSFNRQLVASYSDYRANFTANTDMKMFDPFTTAEDRIMNRVSYDYHRPRKTQRADVKVKGKNRLETEMKKVLLEKAQDLLKELEEPTPQEEKTMKNIEKAATNPNTSTGEMLRMALGGKVKSEDIERAELALAGETVDKLEVRIAMAGGERPVKVARTSPGKRKRGKKKPVKVARLSPEKREKKEKNV